MFRFPYILWLDTLKDMWRLIALTTTVIVTILAFAACIKPLSDGKLDVSDLPHFMSLAALPMLAYALPFSGAFGATLVYHRMATDWELTAAQASGISLRKLLVPSLITGILLGGMLLVLNEQVIPRFLRNMEKLVTTDVPKLLVNSIENGRPLKFGGDTVIYADSVQRVQPDAESGATDELLLTKLMTIRHDAQGNIVSEATATHAGLWVYPPEVTEDGTNRAFSVVAIRLLNTVGSQRGKDNAPALARSQSTEFSLAVPNVFRDNVKFSTYEELRELRLSPERLSKVDTRRRDLAFLLAERQMMKSLVSTLEIEHRAAFVREDDDESIILRGAGLQPSPAGWAVQPLSPGGRIEVEIVRKGARDAASGITRYSAESVILTPNPREEHAQRKLKLRLDAYNAHALSGTSVDASLANAPGIPRYSRSDLVFGISPVEQFLSQPVDALVAAAESSPTDAAAVASASELRKVLRDVRRDITSKQHERLAFAAATLVMVITGAVSAIRLKGRLPLTVYLWSFFPALACVITIAGGQQLNRSYGTPGLIMLWAGVALLGLYSGRVYAHLARN